MRRDAVGVLLDAAQLHATDVAIGGQRGFQKMKHAIPRRHGLLHIEPVADAPVSGKHQP